MRTKTTVTAIVIAFCVWPLAAGAQWYEWRDADGAVHVTNQLASAPPLERGSVTALPFGAAAEPAPPDPAPPEPAPPPAAAAPVASAPESEAQRREAHLAARRAHLRLLRASGRALSAEQQQLENILEDEVRADTDAIAALRQSAAETAQ